MSLPALDTLINNASSYIETAKSIYESAESKLQGILETILPEHLRPLAERVARSVPETLFSASMISGSMKIAATGYGIVRLAWAITPILQKVFKGNFAQEQMQEGAKESLERLKAIDKSFRPALFVACGVAAIACTIFGVLSFDPSLVLAGAFFGIISYMALESMDLNLQPAAVAPADVPVQQAPPEPGEKAAESQVTRD